MSHPEGPLTPHRVIASRSRELRKRRGWTAQQLAAAMTEAGVPWDRSIVTNLELGRRSTVSVEEMLTLAYVFNVAPVHLLVPTDAPGGAIYQVIPAGECIGAETARAWIRGQQPIRKATPGGVLDARHYFSEVPASEYHLPGFATPARPLPEVDDLPDGGDADGR